MKTNNPIGKIILILTCTLFTSIVIAQEFARIDLRVIKKNGKTIQGAQIAIIKNDSLVSIDKMPKNDFLKVKLEANANYQIEFGGNNGWIKKKLRILTFGLNNPNEPYFIEMELFKYKSNLDLSRFKEEVGVLRYNSDLENFEIFQDKD